MLRSRLFYITPILLLSCILLIIHIKTYPKLTHFINTTRRDEYFQSTSSQIFMSNNASSSNNSSENYNNSSKDNQIRSWGCSRNKSPFVFVHIGKSGGGSVRERLRKAKQEPYYFCNAQYPSFNIKQQGHNLDDSIQLQCNATTPLGHAISCPQPLGVTRRCAGCYPRSETCQQIYVGHNYLGTELHWLPPKILSNWWEQVDFISSNHDAYKFIQESIETLSPQNKQWCSFGNNSDPRPGRIKDYDRLYSTCSIPLQDRVEKRVLSYFDNYAANLMMTDHNSFHDLSGDMDWSFLYASLPVLRVTIIREPFSWLISKFFWHHKPKNTMKTEENKTMVVICEDIEMATDVGIDQRHIHNYIGPGWAHRYAMKYILQLCGEGELICSLSKCSSCDFYIFFI